MPAQGDFLSGRSVSRGREMTAEAPRNKKDILSSLCLCGSIEPLAKFFAFAPEALWSAAACRRFRSGSLLPAKKKRAGKPARRKARASFRTPKKEFCKRLYRKKILNPRIILQAALMSKI
jgi:hypothetical protein